MIIIRELQKTYTGTGQPVHAVNRVSAEIRDGDFVSIVGHSGSGKSTFLSMVGGILRPDAGTVILDGKDLWAYTDRERSHIRNRQFAFVYQFASLLPTLTTEENVMLPTIFGATATTSSAVRLLEQVGLREKIGRYPGELSGGEQQRVAIARAFINNPSIILADEPTGDLDEETEAEIMNFFEQANREQKVTIIMVTHNTDLANRASRRFRMRHGVLEEYK